MKRIDLNPTPDTLPVSTVAARLGVNHTAIVSAIHGGKVAGAVKLGGLWHVKPGAVWERWPVGSNHHDRRGR
jgi:hypothetical protein